MFIIVGAIIVVVAVIGGYLMEGGNLHVLMQPAELVIIGGAAIGSFVIATPLGLLKFTLREALGVFKKSPLSKSGMLELLLALFELLNFARREGLVALEKHVEKPKESPIFSRYTALLRDHETVEFICDTLKIMLAGNAEPHQLDTLMDTDMEIRHAEENQAPASLTKVADSLPGLGIVAAVLGVVLTMGKISEPPEVLGHSIGAALVGTFLGILACYGFLGPMATHMEHRVRERGASLVVVKACLLAFADGWAPVMAIEAARRAAPPDVRPGFSQLEEALKNAKR